MNKIIYTTIDDLNLKNYQVQSYKNLGENFASWIERTTIDLMKKSTFAERKFSSLLKEQPYKVYEQAFFKIGDKSYFLDFFLPELNLAFEINGSVHKKNMDKDFERDLDFKKIGIKTIRFTNREVYQSDIKSKVNEYARKAIKGEFDVSEYYTQPISNKFDDRMTINQRFLYAAIDNISKVKPNSKVLIKTTVSYLISVLNHLPEERLNRYFNDDMLRYFYHIIRERNITYDVVFIGDRKNIKGKLKRFVEGLDETPLINKNDTVVILDGETTAKYRNKKYSEVLKEIRL